MGFMWLGKSVDERTIFEQEALDHADEVSRDAFLRRACGEDTRLRDRVDLLLAAHGKEFRLLDDQVSAVRGRNRTRARRVDFSSQTIGRYKLLQKIGEGGFGVVYMAEQQRPVRRKVAIKIIKPGMDTKEVIARFEAERQALALMDHPNIARVLDAGETDEGRPYFAMELVKGVPLTDFCDQNKLRAASDSNCS